MSMSERHAYQRLLGALTRRHEIIASCERILRLCGHNEVKYDGEDRFGFEMGSNLHSDHDMDLAISFDMELDPAVVADSDQDLHYLNSDNPPSQTDPQMQRWQCLQDLQSMRSGMALPETSQVPDVCCRPYISVRSRDVIRKILPSTDAIAGDVIHVPFTAREMTLLMRSAEQCFGVPDLKKLASLMPGRTVTDIRLAWLDHLLGLESDHDQIVLYQQPVRPPPTCHVHAADALSMRPKPVVRETSQGGECVRDTHWIYRLGYIHAECTFRMQMEQVLNDIVTGVTEDTSHLAVIVGMGAEGAGSSLLLDMHDLSIRSLSGHSGVVTEALFTSDGRYILTGSDDKTVCIYNSATSAFTHSVKAPNPLVRLAQHRQEPICALASRDSNTLNLVNASSHVSHNLRLPFTDTVLDFCFGAARTSSQNLLIAGFQHQSAIFKYQLQSSGLRKSGQIADEDGNVFVIRSVPNSASAYASSFLFASESEHAVGTDRIKIWDARERGVNAVTIRSHTGRGRHMIGDMAVSPDGRYLQTSGSDGCVCISDLRRLGSRPLLVLKHQHDMGQPSEGVATEWSHDSRFLLTGADDCTVRVWDMYANDRESNDAGLIRTIDGNRAGDGCVHIVAAAHNSSTFIYGTKLGQIAMFEQERRRS